MEQVELQNKQVIDFYNESNVVFWTRKLNVTHQQLTDAVINTGSVYISDIKSYIGVKEKVFSIFDLLEKLRTKN